MLTTQNEIKNQNEINYYIISKRVETALPSLKDRLRKPYSTYFIKLSRDG